MGVVVFANRKVCFRPLLL